MGNLSAGLSLALSIWMWVILALQICSALAAMDELLGAKDRARRRWPAINLGLQILIITTGIVIWVKLP